MPSMVPALPSDCATVPVEAESEYGEGESKNSLHCHSMGDDVPEPRIFSQTDRTLDERAIIADERTQGLLPVQDLADIVGLPSCSPPSATQLLSVIIQRWLLIALIFRTWFTLTIALR